MLRRRELRSPSPRPERISDGECSPRSCHCLKSDKNDVSCGPRAPILSAVPLQRRYSRSTSPEQRPRLSSSPPHHKKRRDFSSEEHRRKSPSRYYSRERKSRSPGEYKENVSRSRESPLKRNCRHEIRGHRSRSHSPRYSRSRRSRSSHRYSDYRRTERSKRCRTPRRHTRSPSRHSQSRRRHSASSRRRSPSSRRRSPSPQRRSPSLRRYRYSPGRYPHSSRYENEQMYHLPRVPPNYYGYPNFWIPNGIMPPQFMPPAAYQFPPFAPRIPPMIGPHQFRPRNWYNPPRMPNTNPTSTAVSENNFASSNSKENNK